MIGLSLAAAAGGPCSVNAASLSVSVTGQLVVNSPRDFRARLGRAMRKLLIISSALAIVTAFAAAPAAAASNKSAQTRAEKRAQCTAEAKAATGLDRGRGFRTRYRACMVRR
jgi:hypothetical protein